MVALHETKRVWSSVCRVRQRKQDVVCMDVRTSDGGTNPAEAAHNQSDMAITSQYMMPYQVKCAYRTFRKFPSSNVVHPRQRAGRIALVSFMDSQKKFKTDFEVLQETNRSIKQ